MIHYTKNSYVAECGVVPNASEATGDETKVTCEICVAWLKVYGRK